MSGNEVKKPQYDYFKSQVRRWIKTFGLFCYDVGFNQDAEDEARASCWANVTNGLATISINPEWDIEPTKKELAKAAFHETMELFFAEIRSLANERCVTEEQIDRSIHRLIRTLESVVLEKS